MKTLVKVLKVEDNTVYYAEICKKTGKVMIEDYMSTERFENACSDDREFGFVIMQPKVKKSVKIERLKAGTDLDGKPLSWGTVSMEITCSNSELLNRMINLLDSEGWGDHNTNCGEDNSIIYCVESSELADFKASYKDVKKVIMCND